MSSSAEKRSYGGPSGQTGSLERLVGAHLSRGLFASVDVSVDEVEVL